jgi:cytochrome c-type biogenesis protein CcmF
VILVGELALWVALLMAAWGAIVSVAGGRTERADLVESGRRSVYAAFACLVLAISGLMVALVSSDFTFRFVASFTSANLPVSYKVAALWSGPAGTLLFCTFVLSTCAAIAVVASSERDGQRTSHEAGVFSTILLFFVVTLCFVVNPYERTVPVPVEGQGMFPLFQHPGFVLHGPMLYVGSIAASVPFALAMSGLAAGRIDGDWRLSVVRWAIFSWFLLTIGMLAGMWWAYVEVGDGGHWALDPVRNLSILPWLTTSALMYAMRWEDRRGAPGRASILLAAASFPLAVLGMFIVRGGIISMSPVASWSGVVEWLTAFLAVATLGVAYVLLTRLTRLVVPTTVTRCVGEKRARYGGYAVQVGLVILVASIAGGRFGKDADVTLGSGETATITDPFGDRREFTSQGVSRFDVLNHHVVAVALQVAEDGETTQLITSEERQYVDSRGAHTFNSSTEAGIDYSLKQDVYVVLAGVMGDRAQLRIAFNPLVMWVWIGGAMIAVGGAVAMWGER